MATDNAHIEQRIKEETAKVKVDSYQKVASMGGWSGGGRTLWAVAALGAICGAAIGLVAPFFPLMAIGFSTLPAASTILASTAAFAATGMLTGFSGGLVLGRISGASSAVAQEQEKRLKQWMVRQKIGQNPESEIVPDATTETAPKSFLQRVKDAYRTYVNPKVGLTMAALGAAGGLLMGAAFLATMPASLGAASGVFAVTPVASMMATLTGLTAPGALTGGAIVAYSTGVMAAFGALFSFNLPKVASNMSHFFGELISGKYYGREWGPKEQGMLRSPAQASFNQDVSITANGNGKKLTTPNEQLADEAIAAAKFADKQKKPRSYQERAAMTSTDPNLLLR
jgi:hypothetical protein